MSLAKYFNFYPSFIMGTKLIDVQAIYKIIIKLLLHSFLLLINF